MTVIGGILFRFETSTILDPKWCHHDEITRIAAILMVLCSAIVGFTKVKADKAQRIVVAFLMAFIGVVAGFSIFSSLGVMFKNWTYFNLQETRSFDALIPIDYAYISQGRRKGWLAATFPAKVEVRLSEGAYNMLFSAGKRAEIGPYGGVESNGTYCIRAKVEQSRNAIRLLDAGRRQFPRSALVTCPSPPLTKIMALN